MYVEKPLGSQEISTVMSVYIIHRMVTKKYVFFLSFWSDLQLSVDKILEENLCPKVSGKSDGSQYALRGVQNISN